jgi:hypothetical protein
MDVHHKAALELTSGRWRSQIIYAGVRLGIIEALSGRAAGSGEVAAQLSLNPGNTYRLMRALAAVGALEEERIDRFRLTPLGECFLADHPTSLRGILLWEEGEMAYRSWRHLSEVVRDGGEDGCRREFGLPAFEHLGRNEEFAQLFADAMTSFSRSETSMVLNALGGADLGGIRHLCDIGGGQGHLMCGLLQAYEHIRGTVVELPTTLKDKAGLLANSMGLAGRCAYVEGDMFSEVPTADAYIAKHILHDWNDGECIQILSTARLAGADGARFFIAEYVVPGPGQPDFSKLFDVHMMVMLTGRERTEQEFIQLLDASGWKHVKTWRQPESSMAVVEGVAV